MRSKLKRRNYFNHFRYLKANIILLQETHGHLDDEVFWRSEWGGQAYFSHGEKNARGVAILIQKNFACKFIKCLNDNFGRIIAILFEIDSQLITICSIYAPNQDKPEFFVEALNKVEELQNDLKIIAGDFNTVLSVERDIRGGKGFSNQKTREFINEYMELNDIVDIWRICNPDVFRSTYIDRRNEPNILMERIDYFLISSALVQNIVKTDILLSFVSDHAPVLIQLQIIPHIPGKGYWKLNNSLLNDDILCQEINEAIVNIFVDLPELDIFEKWELIKLAAREKFIVRSARLTKSRDNKLKALEKKLAFLIRERDGIEIPNFSIFNDLDQQILLIKSDIEEIMSIKSNGCFLRSKARFFELGEKPTSYFLSLEKHNHNKKTILRLEDPQTGTVHTDPANILDILNVYYKKLYSLKNIDLDPDYLATLNIPQISEGDKYMLDGPIQLEEIHIALKQLKINKCPGVDGLTPEFYLKFWPLLAKPMHKLFQEIVSRKILHSSARDGVLSLLDKPYKNLLKVTNWCPLTLLNTDYKLFAKVLSNRLQHVLPALIHSDQSGYMKGRNIADNILDLLSVIKKCEEDQIPAILLSVDFKKAYDSLDWTALKEILRAFNFGEDFISMVMICYTDIRTAVINNNHWSAWFKPKSGLEQGCVLSCFLFILAIEILALKIRQNDSILGIQFNNKVKKLGQFVDDLWTVLRFDIDSFQELLFEFIEFKDFTGLDINYDKTEILRLGSLRYSDAKFYSTLPIKWSDGPIKILGVFVHSCFEELLSLNYDKLVVKVENIMKSWLSRQLTLIGKIQIVNSLITSQFTYQLQCLPDPPKYIIDKILQLIKFFIWDGRRAKISYKRLISSYKDGGLQLRDLELANKSLKLAKFKTLLLNQHFWTEEALGVFPISPELILKLNFSRKDVSKFMRPSFFTDMCKEWADLNFTSPDNCNDIFAQILWFNSFIKVDEKWHFSHKMYIAGVVKVIDLFNLDFGRFYSYQEFIELYENSDVNFLEFHQIISAIPREWKRILLENQPSPPKLSLDFREKFESTKIKPSRFCYDFLRSQIGVSNIALSVIWNNDLCLKGSDKIDTTGMSRLFKKIRKTTSCTKLIYFQYRLVTKSLTTNIHVAKWNENVSELCTFCKTCKETTVHLFFECKAVQKLFKALTKWLNYFHAINITLTKTLVLFNNYSKRQSTLINFVLLVTKFYIYKCKVQNVDLNFVNLVSDIKSYQNIERLIAFKNDKLYQYARKWDDFSVFI